MPSLGPISSFGEDSKFPLLTGCPWKDLAPRNLVQLPAAQHRRCASGLSIAPLVPVPSRDCPHPELSSWRLCPDQQETLLGSMLNAGAGPEAISKHLVKEGTKLGVFTGQRPLTLDPRSICLTLVFRWPDRPSEETQ